LAITKETLCLQIPIRNTKAESRPAKLNDGKGLYLEVSLNGSKLWRYRYKINGKENLLAIGEYCQIPTGETEEQALVRRQGRSFTHSEARSERERCRGLVTQGIHPSHNQRIEKIRRSAESVNTFKAIAEAWIKEHSEWVELVVEAKLGVELGFNGVRLPLACCLPKFQLLRWLPVL